MRIKHTRDMYIPAGALKVAHKASSAVAYLYRNADGTPCAMAFHGRAQKPTWRYRFSTDQRREAAVARFFASVQESEDRRAAYKAGGRGLAVGDVLSAWWGYEQTNIDWFEVTALVGKTMVELRPIAAEREETQWLQGKTVPMVGRFTGEPIRRVATQGRVRIDQVRTATLVEPTARIGGKAVYAAAHFTAYA